MSILDYVPEGYTLREVQRKALVEVEQAWDTSDVLVIPVPVGGGKSIIAMTIARWQRGAAILTPQVMLQDQYDNYNFGYPVLKGRERYDCTDRRYYTCADKAAARPTKPNYCADCCYVKTRNRAIEEPIAVFNYHSYYYNKKHKPVMIVDEAHNVLPFLSEQYSLRFWKHKDYYPDDLDTIGDIAVWLEGHIAELTAKAKGYDPESERGEKLKRKVDKLQRVFKCLHLCPAHYVITHAVEYYEKRKKPCLRVRPLSMEKVPHSLWPKAKVEKVVLMSSTINHKDVKRMGLASRRVRILSCKSPITPDRRPFKVMQVANMGFKHQEKSLPKIAAAIQLLANRHPDTKGIVHIPYGLVSKFKALMKGDRWMFHNKKDKDEVFQQFRSSEKPAVLFACGMDQGIDLAGKEFGWQVIAKVLWPSRQDPIINLQAREDPSWYAWMTVRTTIQQYGRICRGPSDEGITYIVDSSFKSFYQRTEDMWPEFVKEAVQWV